MLLSLANTNNGFTLFYRAEHSRIGGELSPYMGNKSTNINTPPTLSLEVHTYTFYSSNLDHCLASPLHLDSTAIHLFMYRALLILH